jgi:hypothetical protein
MQIRTVTMIALVAAMATPSFAHGPRRHVDAHEHGAGKLAIAIENASVQMELEVPAHDIVGFEHAPSNARQRKAIEDAKARLSGLAGIVTPSAAAGCALAEAKVELIGAAAEAGKADKATSEPKPGAKKAGKDDHAHSEFKATWRLACASLDKLSDLTFGYFKTFKGADKLTVTVIGPKGQTSTELTRRKPVLSLAGTI